MSYAFLGKSLMITGGLLLLLGAALFLASRLHLKIEPLLPGDIFLKKGGLTIFFPLVTCLVLSLLLTLFLNFLAILRR